MLAIIYGLVRNDRRFVVKGWFSLDREAIEGSGFPRLLYFFAFVLERKPTGAATGPTRV